MRLIITTMCDVYSGMRIAKKQSGLNKSVTDSFHEGDYGVSEMLIVLRCIPDDHFSDELIFHPKEDLLEIVINFEHDQFKVLSKEAKINAIYDGLKTKVPSLITQHTKPNFDKELFLKDFIDMLDQRK